jgi:uncharacterized protein (TIGR03437 family)
VTPGGQISTFAGTGGTTSGGDGGPASEAQIVAPGPLAFDRAGNLYVAQSDGSIIRKITPGGTITRLAGPGGAEPVEGLFYAAAIAADSKGQVFLLDRFSYAIWKIGLDGKIQLFAKPPQDYIGTIYQAQIWTDPADNLLFLDANSPVLMRFSPGGQLISREALSVPYVQYPQAFTVDAQSNIYAADRRGKIFKLSPDGSVSTVWDTVFSPNYPGAIFPLTIDPAGNIYFADQARNRVFEIPNASSCAIAQRPLVASPGAFNAASYQSGLAAPGEIVTLFGIGVGPAQGAGPSIIGGQRFDVQAGNTRVLFDGTPAPVVYASSTQVSAIVPYSVAGQNYTNVSIEVSGAPSDPIPVSVSDAGPGIFTHDGSGKGQAAALNQDYSVNSSLKPAAVGSVIMLFATGEGLTNPAGTDGIIAGAIAPRPILPITATVDGQPAEVLYAGGAPFEVAGVLQINVRLPLAARTGTAIPLRVQVGTHTSADGVTIAIQ